MGGALGRTPPCRDAVTPLLGGSGRLARAARAGRRLAGRFLRLGTGCRFDSRFTGRFRDRCCFVRRLRGSGRATVLAGRRRVLRRDVLVLSVFRVTIARFGM
ncbi:hypothetical protein, partial [Burkholderia territorii]|uniref:hypothetical protein n=1 Tax=Burkholderia territorii TaxID=1503055 RepID=UPI001478777E